MPTPDTSAPNLLLLLALRFLSDLVNLLLLVDAELSRAAVDQQEESTDDGQDLEEVVLGKILVGVVLVQLST